LLQSVKFLPVKNDVILEALWIDFPSDYNDQSDSKIIGDVWKTFDFQLKLTELTNRYHPRDTNALFPNYSQELVYPIIVNFEYQQDGEKKTQRSLYYIGFTCYNARTIKIKNLLFISDFNKPYEERVRELDFYDNFYGVKYGYFIRSEELDSILSQNKNTLEFFMFIKKYCCPSYHTLAILDTTAGNKDSVTLELPLFMKDAISKTLFDDSIKYFVTNKLLFDERIRPLINKVDSFNRLIPNYELFYRTINLNSFYAVGYIKWFELMDDIKGDMYLITQNRVD
jgi:hypothetical protein